MRPSSSTASQRRCSSGRPEGEDRVDRLVGLQRRADRALGASLVVEVDLHDLDRATGLLDRLRRPGAAGVEAGVADFLVDAHHVRRPSLGEAGAGSAPGDRLVLADVRDRPDVLVVVATRS